MKCPHCQSVRNKAFNTVQEDLYTIRYRGCEKCGFRWTSWEIPVLLGRPSRLAQMLGPLAAKAQDKAQEKAQAPSADA